MPGATELAGDTAHIHPYILGGYNSVGGQEMHCRPVEIQEGIVRHSGPAEFEVLHYGIMRSIVHQSRLMGVLTNLTKMRRSM